MAKSDSPPPKKKAGRPPTSVTSKSRQYCLRMEPALLEALELYRDKYRIDRNLQQTSDALRHILQRVLAEEGFYK